MADVKISELPVASTVNANDILVMNQGGTTKTATQALIVAGLASTAQVAAITPASIGALSTSAAPGFATTSQIASITPASIGALATSDASSFATTAQLNSITPASIGAIPTTQQSSFATTSQISGFTNTAQVAAISSAQIAAITPASIGAIATSQQSSFATTSQISAFTTSSQVAAISSAQIAGITPASIGAEPAITTLATSKGGTGQSTYADGELLIGNSTGNTLTKATLIPGANVTITNGPGTITINATGGGGGGGGTVTSVTAGAGLSGGTIVNAGTISLATLSPNPSGTFGSTAQIPSLTVNQYGQVTGITTQALPAFATTAQVAAITPASIGAIATSQEASFATTAQVAAITPASIGAIPTSAQAGFATTSQISGLTNTAQVVALTTQQLSAISVNAGTGLTGGGSLSANSTISLAALSPDPSGSFGNSSSVPVITINQFGQITQATTQAIPQYATTAQASAIASQQIAAITPASIGAIATSQQSSFATTSQLAGITPSSIGALSTSSIIAISNGGTGATSAIAALSNLGALEATASVGGDLSGNLPNPTVAKIQGYSVAATAPANGQVLTWNGSAWVPSAASSGGSGGGGVLFYMNYGTAGGGTIPTGAKELGRTAEISQTSITSGTLTTGVWTDIVGFVSDNDPLDPNLEFLPAGIFDFNVWARSSANVNAPTSLRCLVYTWNGTTSTLIATSGVAICSNNGTTVQTAISMVIPQTDITPADRLYIVVQANASAAGHNVTLDFGGETPSHVHTTIPSVGGTGVVKVINGVPQNPASPIVDSDISTAALISLSKIQMSQVSINTIDGLTGGGDLSASRTLSLTTTGISAGSFGSSAQIPAFTVDAYGRLTSATNIPFAGQPALTTSSPLAISLGGTGATTALQAFTNLGAQPALTTANPLAISSGGTGSITGDDAIVNLGFPNQIRSVAGRVNLGVGTVAGQTYTVTANGALTSTDTTTLSNGDLVVSVLGSSGTQNYGFYIVTNVGSATTQAVLTRPSWFQNGTTWNHGAGLFIVPRSNTAQGNIYAIVPTSGSINNWTIGTAGLVVNTFYNRSGNSTLGSNTYISSQVFAGGGPTVSPARFQAGSLLTTVTPHAIEWDGTQMYVTNASTERLPVATSKAQINAQTTNYTIALADAGYLVTANNAAAISVQIPTDASVAFPVGTQVLVMQLGAGQVTVSAVTPGTTSVNSKNGTKTSGQYAIISLIKVAANSWVVGGDATT